jgi:hypothetical protein
MPLPSATPPLAGTTPGLLRRAWRAVAGAVAALRAVPRRIRPLEQQPRRKPAAPRRLPGTSGLAFGRLAEVLVARPPGWLQVGYPRVLGKLQALGLCEPGQPMRLGRQRSRLIDLGPDAGGWNEPACWQPVIRVIGAEPVPPAESPVEPLVPMALPGVLRVRPVAPRRWPSRRSVWPRAVARRRPCSHRLPPPPRTLAGCSAGRLSAARRWWPPPWLRRASPGQAEGGALRRDRSSGK